jgi:hypothetical protein
MNTKTTALLAKLRGEIPAAASHPLMPAAGRESLLSLLQLAELLAEGIELHRKALIVLQNDLENVRDRVVS